MHVVLKCGNCNLETVRGNMVVRQSKGYYRGFILGLKTCIKVIDISSAQCLWRGKYRLVGGLQGELWSAQQGGGLSGLAGVKSVLTRQISAIYSTVHQMKVNTRSSLQLKFRYRTRLSRVDYLWGMLHPGLASLDIFLACSLFLSHFFFLAGLC